MRSIPAPYGARAAGFGMIEVLVAVAVLAVGLFGLAGLQVMSLQGSQAAYQRTQASLLASGLADRMRVRSGDAAAGVFNDPREGETVDADRTAWNAEIAATLGTGAAGSVTSPRARFFRITVRWPEPRRCVGVSAAECRALWSPNCADTGTPVSCVVLETEI